jgi:arylamine N-acetyltransferase
MSEHIPVGKRPKHAAAIVTYNGIEYLVDTAFGSLSPLSPIRLQEGEYSQFSEKFRILRDNNYPFTLQLWHKDEWLSLFGFSKKAATKQDYLRENILQQNPLNPESTFRTFFLCSKPFKINNDQNGYVKIYNNKLIIRRRGKVTYEREITSQSDLHGLIKKYFKIDLKGHIIRFSELDMSANLIGIHQPPVVHQYSTRLQQKYKMLKQELNIPEIVSESTWSSRLRKAFKG